jgi:hypothetical protein
MDRLKYIPLGLFVLLVSKMLYMGCGYADAPSLLIIAALAAFYEYKPVNAELKALKDNSAKMEKDLEDLRSHVSSLKLARDLKATRSF